MASKVDIGPKIGIDGEAEFRKQLKEINSGLKTLGTEAKAVAAEFQGQENSTEALTAKTDILTRQILSLKDGLELQSRMLAESAEQYGEADERTQRWQQAVNNTTAEIAKLQRQLDTETAKLGEAQDATGQLTGEIDRQEQELQQLQRAYSNAVLEQGKSSDQAEELAGKIRGLSGELEVNRSKLGEASVDLGSVGDSAEGLSGILGGSLQVALGNLATQGFNLLVEGAQAAIGALSEAVTESAAFADEILTLSAQTGLSTDTLQEFAYMADLVDVPVSTLQGSLAKLTRSMDSYRSGNAQTTEAFEELGLSMDTIVGPDGSLRNAEDVWYVVIDALGQIQSQTERDAIAMAIFGRSAQELNPIINQGSAGLRTFAQEAMDAGAVLSEDQVAALGEVDDAFVRLDQTMQIIQRQIAAELAPEIKDLIVAFTELVTSLDWAAIVEGLSAIITSVTDLINAVKELVQWWNQFTGGTSMSDTMWDGGHSAAAKISTPNYNTLAAQEALNRSAYANERTASSRNVSNSKVEIGLRGDAGKMFYTTVREEETRQGPSIRTQR